MKEKVIVALDVNSREDVLRLTNELHDLCGMFKVGSQLFMSLGPPIVKEIIAAGGKVFLDLKYHDIPNTVTQAAIKAAELRVSMMTIHASGGRTMMQSVVNELGKRFPETRPFVVAVTVLTSLDTHSLFEMGIELPLEQYVRRLARLAEECGIDGVVCSPREISAIRGSARPDFKIVVPGVRMPDQPADDQQRTATPSEAVASGADHIVVGRAVTAQSNPRQALEQLLGSLITRAGTS
jgi:orotidine-5'-phosphate decarboxylase